MNMLDHWKWKIILFMGREKTAQLIHDFIESTFLQECPHLITDLLYESRYQYIKHARRSGYVVSRPLWFLDRRLDKEMYVRDLFDQDRIAKSMGIYLEDKTPEEIEYLERNVFQGDDNKKTEYLNGLWNDYLIYREYIRKLHNSLRIRTFHKRIKGGCRQIGIYSRQIGNTEYAYPLT